jgi:hypothetical protein
MGRIQDDFPLVSPLVYWSMGLGDLGHGQDFVDLRGNCSAGGEFEQGGEITSVAVGELSGHRRS